MQSRFDEDRQERERAMMDIRETQNRLGRAGTYGRGGEEEEEEGIGGGSFRNRMKTQEQLAERKQQRSRYQFEATGSDDELEDELDDNLDEIGEATKRLKALGMAMNQELDNQIGRIGRIEDKTTNLDNRVYRNTERVCALSTLVVRSLTGSLAAQTHQVGRDTWDSEAWLIFLFCILYMMDFSIFSIHGFTLSIPSLVV